MQDNENKVNNLFKISNYDTEIAENLYSWLDNGNVQKLETLDEKNANHLISFAGKIIDNLGLSQFSTAEKLFTFSTNWLAENKTYFLDNTSKESNIAFLKTNHSLVDSIKKSKKSFFEFQIYLYESLIVNKDIDISIENAVPLLNDSFLSNFNSLNSNGLNEFYCIERFLGALIDSVNCLSIINNNNLAITCKDILAEIVKSKDVYLEDRERTNIALSFLLNKSIEIFEPKISYNKKQLRKLIERILSENDYKIIHAGKITEITWAGNKYKFNKTNGMQIIEYLINKTSKNSISIQDLSQYCLSEVLLVSSNEKDPSFQKSIEKIHRQIEIAEEMRNFDMVETLRAEVIALSYRGRRASPEVERARSRITNCVAEAIKKIQSECPELAEYLSKEISTGYNFQFKNISNISWC